MNKTKTISALISVLFLGIFTSCEKQDIQSDAATNNELNNAVSNLPSSKEQEIIKQLQNKMVVFPSVEDYVAKSDFLNGEDDGYEKLQNWANSNVCLLPGVEGEVLFEKYDFSQDDEASNNMLERNAKLVDDYIDASGERIIEPVYSHLEDRFFLNEDRMFIVGNEVVKNIENEMLSANVCDYELLKEIETVEDYNKAFNVSSEITPVSAPEHPNKDDAKLKYGQRQIHTALNPNGNFKLTVEPYVKDYNWVLYKALIVGVEMHNYSYNKKKKAWVAKKSDTKYGVRIEGVFYTSPKYIGVAKFNKSGDFNASKKKRYNRYYHANMGVSGKIYPFIDNYDFHVENNNGCSITEKKQ